jgi:peroxin-12
MEFITSLRHSTFDESKPSLFELLSESQLSSLLPPTLRYLLTVLTQRHPRYLLWILNSFDELYALLFLAVERHYLLTRSGSFTEHFYGLKRERCLVRDIPRASAAAPAAVRDATRLSKGDVWRNLAVLVGVPYLKRKLDEAFEIEAPRAAVLGRAYTTLPAGAGWRERARFYYRWFLRRVYPSLNALYYLSLLAFNLAYLFDRTRYHSPLLWLVGTRVRRMGAADYMAVEMLSKSQRDGGHRPGSVLSPRNVGARVLGGLSIVLPTSIFALKFLEWWYASDFAKQLSRRAAESLDLPPPVVAGLEEGEKKSKGTVGRKGDVDGEDEKDDVGLKEGAPIATPSLLPIYTVSPLEDSALCPICGDEIVTATACQTGVVYCYTCIHRWIAGQHPRQEQFMKDKGGKWESGEGRCAVTGRRVLGGTEGLRRIMV